MKSEEEISKINDLFQARIRKQAVDQRRTFYFLLVLVLGFFALGFILCLIFVK